ncbi:hypothetical protein ACWEJ6_44640 [Nonomuraea sp. NPDC004702]
MGIRLIVEALDHAPASLTPRERYALLVLAEDANDRTRLLWNGVEGNEKVVQRLRAGRSERAAILKALIDKGAIERVKRGQKQQHAEFRIRPMAPLESREEDVSIRESRTHSQHPENPENADAGNPGNPDPEQQDLLSASGFCPPSVRETRTPTPHTPQQEEKKKPSSSKSKKPKADTPPREDVEQLCGRLLEWAIKKDYHGRPDTVPDEWRTEARLLLDKDKVPLQDALDVLDWSQRDPFWRGVLHAMPKFRKQYGQLEFKSRGFRGASAGQQQRSTSRPSAPGANPNQFTEEDFNDCNFG